MPDGLGTRLREARQERGLSLRSLAQAVGVSPSFVSQVEMGKTSPSVSTLYAMSNLLEVSLDELVGREAPVLRQNAARRVVQRSADNPVIELESGVRWERLASEAEGPTAPVLVTFAPGGSSSSDGTLMRHAGVEYAYLLEGQLILRVEFDEITVSPGDSLCFDSQRPHLFRNPGPGPARGIWFVAERADGAPAEPLVRSARPVGSPAAAVDVLRSLDQLD